MENDFHNWLREHLPQQARTLIGVGDDAAVLNWAEDDRCIVTSDMLAEGVHFELAEAGARRVGRKCLAVNLSDVAAMGAQPVAAVVSLMLPADASPALPQELLTGMLPLAKEFKTTIVGGDTNVWSGKLVVSVTVLATMVCERLLCRDGAQAGNILCVTGPLGGSILGHHLDFTPRVEIGQRLNREETAVAAMDISDGLALDASRMAAQSGCGIEVFADRIPISNAAITLSESSSGKTALQHALGDGEDFELLVAVPQDRFAKSRKEKSSGLIEIGRCVQVEGKDSLWLIDANGERQVLSPAGYVHGQ